MDGDAVDPRERLDEAVGEYLDRLNAGEDLDPIEILEQHPDLGDEILRELRAFLDLGEEDRTQEPLGTLGDYTLRRQIGRGGMGVVYEAWENSMDRAVALKVLPAGTAADDRMFQRFLREARTSGKLSHPNVVHVYGVGIKERTPYYAMELVDGETLAKILATLRDAEPESETVFGRKDRPAYFEKLAETFADVADGLQHAHSKGVIHRDIKPSNLILDRGGRLRVLDFGLAHLEGEETLTVSGEFLGTPLYMSPEQARRRRIALDHRTDVYSLGATLYEMLTGSPPFQGRDHQDTLSQIIARDPPQLRKLNLRIPTDLETIVLKCLRKDPADRYNTAEALSQDLRRFVRGDPIEARPQTGVEKLARRLWRRRWALAAAVSAILVALVGFAVATLVVSEKERRTQAALDEARESFHRAHRAVESFLTLVAEGDLPLVPGRENERKKLLESALEFYLHALHEKGDQPFLLDEAAKANLRVGRVYAKLGEAARAEEAYRHAIDLSHQLLSASPERADYRSQLGRAYSLLGMALMEANRLTDARGYLEAALDCQRKLAGDFPAQPDHRHELAGILSNVGTTYVGYLGSGPQNREEVEKARDLFDEAAREESAFLDGSPTHAEGRFFLSKQLGNLGAVLAYLGDHTAAEARQREALEVLRKLVLEVPEDPQYRAHLASLSLGLGVLLQFDLERPGDAEALYRETLEIQEKLTGDFPETPDHHSDLGALLNNLAQVLIDRGEIAEAGQFLERAVREQTAAARANSRRPDYRMRLVQHYSNLAVVRARETNGSEAETCHTKVIALQEALAADFPRNGRLRSDLAFYVREYARHLVAEGRKDEAEKAYRKALANLEKVVAESPESGEHQNDFGKTLKELSGILLERGDLDGAREHAAQAISRFEDGVRLRPGHVRYELDLREGHALLAGVLSRLGDHRGAAAEARALARAAGAGPEDFYRAAVIHARAANLARGDPATKEHVAGAVDLLRQALGKGLEGPDRLRTAEELADLRGEGEFEELLRELPAATDTREDDSRMKEGGQQ